MRCVAVWLSMVVLFGVNASGENRVKNAYFDADLTHWTTGLWVVNWVGDEGFQAPPLGAAEVVATSTGSSVGAIALSQCVEVVGGQDYDVGVAFKENLGSSTQTGGGRFRIYWHTVASCANAGIVVFDLIPVSGLSGWQPLYDTGVTAPAEMLSARITLIQTVDGAGDHRAFWDAVLFEPTADIFQDGFESGNLSAWSSSVP